MPDIAYSVAEQLAELRRQEGLTLESLAERSGLHRTSIGLVERHERTLTINSAQRLCAALGVRLSDLVRRAEDDERIETPGPPTSPPS